MASSRLTSKGSSPLGKLSGLLHHLANEQPIAVEEMKEAVRRKAGERFRCKGEHLARSMEEGYRAEAESASVDEEWSGVETEGL